MNSSLVLLAGILLAAGLVCLVAAAIPTVPRLEAALERVGTDGPPPRTVTAEVGAVTRPSERLGALLYRLTPMPLSDEAFRAWGWRLPFLAGGALVIVGVVVRMAVSESPLFLQIRTALERARLEQQPPYDELRRIADQLRLPELADVADVMQLDETGAALSGTLRARVRELRDAHLSSEQTKASAAAEGMTIYMTLPALIFSLIFLVAAMLKIFFPEAP